MLLNKKMLLSTETCDRLISTKTKRALTCDMDRCHCGWLGEWWLLELPDDELLSELMEHMEDLREPRLEGDDGGVRKDQPLSDVLRSAMTCSDAGGSTCGSTVFFSSCCTTSCKCDSSVSIATSSS